MRLAADGSPEAEFEASKPSTGETSTFVLREGESGLPGANDILEKIDLDAGSVNVRSGDRLVSIRGKRADSPAAVIDEGWPPEEVHRRANAAMDRGYLRAAADLYRRGADLGNVKSQANLGAMYLQGRGVPRDLSQAKAWLEEAAASGSASAAFNLGLLFEKPEVRDLVKAKAWYGKARAAGFERANTALASLERRAAGPAAATARSAGGGIESRADDPAGAVSLPHSGIGLPTFDKVIDGGGTPSIMYMGTPVRVGDRVGKWTLRRVDALEEVVVVSEGPTGQAIVAGLRRPRAAPAPSTPASGGNVFDR